MSVKGLNINKVKNIILKFRLFLFNLFTLVNIGLNYWYVFVCVTCGGSAQVINTILTKLKKILCNVHLFDLCTSVG